MGVLTVAVSGEMEFQSFSERKQPDAVSVAESNIKSLQNVQSSGRSILGLKTLGQSDYGSPIAKPPGTNDVNNRSTLAKTMLSA